MANLTRMVAYREIYKDIVSLLGHSAASIPIAVRVQCANRREARLDGPGSNTRPSEIAARL
jgi:hypothetical protein